ncbi:hypothetical protein MC7420_7860 [Coleofasciculus chthonoplastes PCC 7420]|uniref:Uncharacterized protein n=2 Tax=Coleofasciculus chthonoplastes TaxID=64178 RepID=B4VIC5_9CYAN|nr:hypothetical protein MC7420_7860 [Coleofasciculus chthonoplastes PCC 7420]
MRPYALTKRYYQPTMTKDYKIRNPSITLYPFHLRDDFDEGFQAVAKNAQDLWEILADDIGKTFNIPELQSLRNHLICYQNGQYYPSGEDKQSDYQELIASSQKTLRFQPNSQPDDLQLNGSIYPLRLHDTYTADLTLSVPTQTIPITQLQHFNPNGCLLPDNIKPSLGQTLLLYAEPISFDNYRRLADGCIQALWHNTPQPVPKLIAEGQLLGSPIFEYDHRNLNPAQQCHILVWLKGDPNTLNLPPSNFNYYLINLLFSHAKIRFAFAKSRELYREGQRLTSNIEKEIPQFTKIEQEPDAESRLTQLKQLLARIRTKVFDYTKCLSLLKENSNTLTVNTNNYREILEEIQKLTLADDNLDFLYKFLNLAEHDHQQQIQADLNYLFASQDLFQQMIATIRGMVEIEQIESDRRWQATENRQSRQLQEALARQEAAQREQERQAQEQAKQQEAREKKRERRLEDIIFFVGTVIGASGIFGSSYPLLQETPIQWHPDALLPIHPFVGSILWSIIFGIAIGLVTLFFLILIRKLLES